MKVMTIVGTRPEIIRLSRIIDKCDRYFDHVLVHTGQNYDYELNEVFFKELEIRNPDIFLEAAGETAAETIGNVISRVDAVIAEHEPDAVLILGDTNSALSALPAKRRKVPIFHMEAGNRCFDFRVPEEINRRMVDHISDINLPYSQIARDYLVAEGFDPQRIIVTGSPMREVLDYYAPKIAASTVLDKLDLKPRNYFLVSAHREENVDSPERLNQLIESLKALKEVHNLPILISTHPRTRKRLDSAGISDVDGFVFHKPFGFPDYIKLQTEAKAVLSDSGTISEEASILNFPALNIRQAHERPEAVEEGGPIMTGFEKDAILSAMAILADQDRDTRGNSRMVADYEPTDVSDKMVRIIQSYTGFVNRTVWKKN